MSDIKRLMEAISIALGYGGKITVEVLTETEIVLAEMRATLEDNDPQLENSKEVPNA